MRIRILGIDLEVLDEAEPHRVADPRSMRAVGRDEPAEPRVEQRRPPLGERRRAPPALDLEVERDQLAARIADRLQIIGIHRERVAIPRRGQRRLELVARRRHSGHGSATGRGENDTERRIGTCSRIARSSSSVRAPNGYAYEVTE